METDYRVELDAYSGPLDLLLFLVRRHEIDLQDIPVAELTEQYLRHLQMMKRIDVDLAGEFLVMAATLLEIKSAMMLPPVRADEEASGRATEALDPRHELVQQLLAYKRFKDAAFDLAKRREQWTARFARQPPRGRLGDEDHEPQELDLEDVHVLDLYEAFSRILDSIGHGPQLHEVVNDDTPIALHAEDIVDRLQRDGPMSLQDMFVGRSSRGEMIGLFLAMLELVRQRRLQVSENRESSKVMLELRSEQEQLRLAEVDGQPVDWRDPNTGEVQYEWPDERTRLQAERRAARRLDRIRQKQAKDDDEDTIVDVDDTDTPADQGSIDSA